MCKLVIKNNILSLYTMSEISASSPPLILAIILLAVGGAYGLKQLNTKRFSQGKWSIGGRTRRNRNTSRRR